MLVRARAALQRATSSPTATRPASLPTTPSPGAERLALLRGPVAAWWALAGLVVTSFAFLGVNMFLSGLHSYGEL